MKFYTDKDLALCGLACVLCSVEDCPGCKARGCAQASDCGVYRCVTERGLDGCYQCGEFPCGEDMLGSTRIRAFGHFAKQLGKQTLLERLRANFENGIAYHKPDGLKGDYDALETEDDIMRLIAFGSHDPYVKCPVLKTEHFELRLVRMEDAEDLLKNCYSDPSAWENFHAEGCTGDFRYQTMEAMQECLEFWLGAYETQSYVRFAIVDKALSQAVGTIEMFGMIGQYKTPQGILRLDIGSGYETTAFLGELFAPCAKWFFILFGVEQMITKAIPAAAERTSALTRLGFKPHDARDIPEHRRCWELDKVQ